MRTNNDAALTASLGDNQMMTFMKMPLTMTSTSNTGITGSPRESTNDSDENFLDGLFDCMSGSSDNGSEKRFDGDDNLNDGDNHKNNSINVPGTSAATGTSRNLHTGMEPPPGPISAPVTSHQQHQQHHHQQHHHQQHHHQAHITGTNTTVNSNALPQQSLPHQSHNQTIYQTICNSRSVHSAPAQSTTNGPQQVAPSLTSYNAATSRANLQQRCPDTNVDQTTAVRAMSDVSSLSSSNGNSSPNLTQPQHALLAASINPKSNNNTLTSANLLTNSRIQTQPYNTWIIPDNKNIMMNQQPHLFANQTMSALMGNAEQLQQKKVQNAINTTQKQIQQHMPNRGKSQGKKRRLNTPAVTPVAPTTSMEHNPYEYTISEDETDAQKRRRDRNMREQERSQKIANQIGELKQILSQSNIPFKPDKYSTLVSVYDYIKSLQDRNVLMDTEQDKLLQTIKDTNELVTRAELGPNATNHDSSVVQQSNSGSHVVPGANSTSSDEEELLAYVRGIDYKGVFLRTNIPLCVTRIDGRIFDCNDAFVRLCGIMQEDLVKAGLREFSPKDNIKVELSEQAGKHPLSLFNLIARDDMQRIFEAMSSMLAVSHVKQEDGQTVKVSAHSHSIKMDHWAGNILRCHSSESQQLNISLVRQKEGTPRFFNCALLPNVDKSLSTDIKVKVEMS